MSRITAFSWVLVAVLVSLSCGDKPDVYDISIPNLKISPDESINALEIRINAGSVQAISHIPIGWQFSVDDDADWMSLIKGRSTSGAATLAPDELKRIAFNVRRNESSDFKFEVSGVVSLSKAFDRRNVTLKPGDFALAPSN